jgi:hypothetical protein
LDAILNDTATPLTATVPTTRDTMHATRTGGVLDSVRQQKAEQRKKRRGIRTLVYVKWISLGYSDATWEDLDDIEDGVQHLARFNMWNQYPPPQKPPPRAWLPFAEVWVLFTEICARSTHFCLFVNLSFRVQFSRMITNCERINWRDSIG